MYAILTTPTQKKIYGKVTFERNLAIFTDEEGVTYRKSFYWSYGERYLKARHWAIRVVDSFKKHARARVKLLRKFVEHCAAMSARTYDENNFYKETKAVFAPSVRPEREPDHISDSGSEYYYTPDGVIRFSDHWNIVATCYWQKAPGEWPVMKDRLGNRWTAGFCKWTDFSYND